MRDDPACRLRLRWRDSLVLVPSTLETTVKRLLAAMTAVFGILALGSTPSAMALPSASIVCYTAGDPGDTITSCTGFINGKKVITCNTFDGCRSNPRTPEGTPITDPCDSLLPRLVDNTPFTQVTATFCRLSSGR